MKTLIAYYSYSGNTDKIVGIFAGILRQKGGVDMQRLRPKDEITSFLGQCMAARAGKRADLQDGVIFDASPYDLVLLGCPVWAFAPTPAMNTYLDKISGLNGKRAIVLLTSGSGLGLKRCFQNIRKTLEEKGAGRIDEINIPNRKQSDNDFVVSSLQKVL